MPRVTQAELARHLDLNRSTVTHWIEAGRISPPGADGLLDLDLALLERDATESPLARDQARKAQLDQIRAEKIANRLAGVEPEPRSKILDAGLSAQEANRELVLLKVEEKRLDIDQRAGLLVERAEVDFVITDIGIATRRVVEALPDRLAPLLAGHRGDIGSLHKILDDACRELLDQIAEHSDRCQKGLGG